MKEKEGTQSASAKTQSKAESIAKGLASKSGGGEVRIHRPKDPIRDSDTVVPGNESHNKDKTY